jgi:branched-chain amino acid transport system substrate-binding protein
LTAVLAFGLAVAVACGGDEGETAAPAPAPAEQPPATEEPPAEEPAPEEPPAEEPPADEPPSAAPSGDPITIGVIQMLTGSSGFYGQALLKGNELAVEQINAQGGVLGRPLQIEYDDNASDNAQTVNLVRKYGQDSEIPALISPTYQPNMEAGCAIANQLGVPQLAGQSAPPPADVNPDGFCFTNSADIVAQVQETIQFVADTYGVTKFAQIFDQQNAYQATFNEVGTDYINDAGLEIVADIGVNTGVTDYGPQITQLIDGGAEVVMPNLTTEDAARFMQQARARGLEAMFVGPNASLVNVRLNELSGGAAEGLIVSTNQSESQEGYASFLEDFNAKFGQLEDPISGFGYDSMIILAQAIEQAGSTDRTAVRDALAAMTEVCASICYKADGNGNFITTELFFQELQGDAWVPLQ